MVCAEGFCLAGGFGSALFLSRTMATEARCVLLFVSGEEAKKVAVGESAKRLGAVTVVTDAGGGEDVRLRQIVERGKGDAVSAIDIAKSGKDLKFVMRVGAAALF